MEATSFNYKGKNDDTGLLYVDEEGHDLLVYHARDYTEIEGDPLWDPNRHTRVKRLEWHDDYPIFGDAI